MESIRRASTPAEWAQAAALMSEYVEWIREAAGFEPLVEQPAIAAELARPAAIYAERDDRALFLAHQRDVAVGSVAIWCHDDGTAELKRMYVRPSARGRGVADRLIGHALDAAADRCCRAVWLETVRGAMDPAIAVYRRNGFAILDGASRTLCLDGLIVMEHRIESQRRCA